jgi:hypothetical protein
VSIKKVRNLNLGLPRFLGKKKHNQRFPSPRRRKRLFGTPIAKREYQSEAEESGLEEKSEAEELGLEERREMASPPRFKGFGEA